MIPFKQQYLGQPIFLIIRPQYLRLCFAVSWWLPLCSTNKNFCLDGSSASYLFMTQFLLFYLPWSVKLFFTNLYLGKSLPLWKASAGTLIWLAILVESLSTLHSASVLRQTLLCFVGIIEKFWQRKMWCFSLY